MTVPELANLLAYAVVLVALPLNVIVTIKLWRLHRAHRALAVLRERGIVAAVLTFVVAVFALVFLNNDLALPLLNVEQTRILTRLAMLALAFPAGYWIWLYRDR